MEDVAIYGVGISDIKCIDFCKVLGVMWRFSFKVRNRILESTWVSRLFL